MLSYRNKKLIKVKEGNVYYAFTNARNLCVKNTRIVNLLILKDNPVYWIFPAIKVITALGKGNKINGIWRRKGFIPNPSFHI